MVAPWFKLWLRRVHLWLALVASLPLLILGFTGALLVFPEPLDSWLTGVAHEVPITGTRLSYSEIVLSMKTALTEGDYPNRLVFGESSESVVTAGSVQGVSLALNPYTGEVLRASKSWTPTRFLTWLHVTLAVGKSGSTIVGVASLILCCLSVTGLLLWWPVGRWNQSYFVVKRGLGWKRWNYDLHRVVGLYSTWAMLLIAISGASMAFHSQVSRALYWATSTKPLDRTPLSIPFETTPAVNADAAVAIAQTAFPGWRVYRLYPPVPKSPAYRVFLNPPHDFESRLSEVRLEIHPRTGEILREESDRTRPASEAILMWVLPLHFGTWAYPLGRTAGFMMQLCYVAASSAPVLLVISGLFLWLNRVWKRWRSKRLRHNGSANSQAFELKQK